MLGIPVYISFFLGIYAFGKRKVLSWKCIIEMIFCIYVLLLLRIVGIFSLHFSLDGIKNYNLIPFVGSAIVPTILNFVLFIPYGILLPIVFVTYKSVNYLLF